MCHIMGTAVLDGDTYEERSASKSLCEDTFFENT